MTDKIIPQCSIADCSKKAITRTFCNKHYLRWRTHGKDGMIFDRDRPLADRFWERVDVSGGASACWIWQGLCTPFGYGKMTVKRRAIVAHRLAWFLTYGKMPTLCLLHSCDNPPCVNPAHLREGTKAENTAERDLRKRTARGSQAGQSKLTESMVRDIRQKLSEGTSGADLGRMYSVNKETIYHIASGRSWKHVE